MRHGVESDGLQRLGLETKVAGVAEGRTIAKISGDVVDG